MRKNIVISIVVIVVTFTLLGLIADRSYKAGSNVAYDKYYINNENDLIEFSRQVNSGNTFQNTIVVQTADLDMTGIQWQTIAPFDSESEFCGIYDGDGYIISNLNVNTDGNNALFGKLGGVVMNLGIINSYIHGSCVGVITSHSSNEKATIINCYSEAYVTGDRVGGIADNFNGDIANCWSDCILNSQDKYMQGGIVSYSSTGMINCYCIGKSVNYEYKRAGSTDIKGINSQEELIRKLNRNIYSSAKAVNVDYRLLNKWEINEGGKVVLTHEKTANNLSFSQYISSVIFYFPALVAFVVMTIILSNMPIDNKKQY
ncbi:MAG: hypothetical protein ACOX6J_02020 [Oscillospiraceae bacterium]|jgi:hypothetical protein